MTVDGENLMSQIEPANRTKTDDLALGTYKHINVTISGMFTLPSGRASMTRVNPMTGVSTKRKKARAETLCVHP